MSPCHYDCSLGDILLIKKRQLADLNQVRENIDVPARYQEVTTKLNIVNGMLRDKLAEAHHLILCIEFGCDQGMAYE